MFYVEACESGSMFEGLLTDKLNIYVTTAANAYESSWGTYCPGTQHRESGRKRQTSGKGCILQACVCPRDQRRKQEWEVKVGLGCCCILDLVWGALTELALA